MENKMNFYDEQDKEEAMRVMKLWADDGLWMLACNFFGAKLDTMRAGIRYRGFWEAVTDLTPQHYPIRNPTDAELEEAMGLREILLRTNRSTRYEERDFKNRNSFQTEQIQGKLWATYRDNSRHYQNLERQSAEIDSQINSIACGLVLKENHTQTRAPAEGDKPLLMQGGRKNGQF